MHYFALVCLFFPICNYFAYSHFHEAKYSIVTNSLGPVQARKKTENYTCGLFFESLASERSISVGNIVASTKTIGKFFSRVMKAIQPGMVLSIEALQRALHLDNSERSILLQYTWQSLNSQALKGPKKAFKCINRVHRTRIYNLKSGRRWTLCVLRNVARLSHTKWHVSHIFFVISRNRNIMKQDVQTYLSKWITYILITHDGQNKLF